MSYYSFNIYECKESLKKMCKGCSKERIKYGGMNASNDIQNYIHTTNNVTYINQKALIFVPSSTNYVWVVKPS